MLKLENLVCGYESLEIIHRVSLTVKEGEIVSLVGPNGAGKSTTLRAISGLIPCWDGKIIFDGRPIGGLPAEEVVKTGMTLVPEGRGLFAPLTVYENLQLGFYSRRRELGKKDKKSLLEMVLDLFPILRKRSTQEAGTLSGGEQQMLAIGRGLMSQPRLLLLDEPSLGLAPKVVEAISDTISKLNPAGLTILLVEQNIRMAFQLASRGYVLVNGQIKAQGKVEKLLQEDVVKELYLGE
ncbi:ABC transporter ATP-binding protein [Thermodesulfobacteriota bacterium]